MKAIKKLGDLIKGRFDATTLSIHADKAEYINHTSNWKSQQDNFLSSYAQGYQEEMATRYIEETNALKNYEDTVTTGIDMLVDNPNLDSDLEGIKTELENDVVRINAAVAAKIAEEEVKTANFIAEFGEVTDFDLGDINNAYTVTSGI